MEEEAANIQPLLLCRKSYRIQDIKIRSDDKAPRMLGRYNYPKPRIILTFSYNYIYYTWIQAQDDLQLLDVHSPTLPLVLPSVDLTREQLFCSKRSHKIIRERIKDLRLDDNVCREIIETLLEAARKALKSIPKGHDGLYLEIALVEQHEHVLPEGSRGFVESNQDNGMTPATDSSIESLENRIALDCDGSCAICMEEYDNDSFEAVFMPCFHVFHGDCIKKWLNKSHVCPLCRFEMPKRR